MIELIPFLAEYGLPGLVTAAALAFAWDRNRRVEKLTDRLYEMALAQTQTTSENTATLRAMRETFKERTDLMLQQVARGQGA